ncbi:hypothetical protein HU200_061906 [Digitaria exilis]|uniref:BURP domain-containing protein n=1 Tax=Digitaria exilis TaxID=1010633 RepID=A0A835E0V7_9POAL|nr:hypothetical protein HU200_061906 [Digitaria exilis]CAB3481510.1 unnamed protein product [Digitaria exilis]
MHPSTFLLFVVAAGATMAHGHPTANTPAAQFWEQALPGSSMPDAIADGIQRGIDHSPLVEHYTAASPDISACTLFDSTCSPQAVAETGTFFHETQLRPGSTMTLSFPEQATPAILPHDVAEKVPFTDVDDVLAAFNIAPGSAEAAQVRNTLRRCAAPPIAGETKSCTTSLEATVQSAMSMFGIDAGVWATASEIPRGGMPRQTYAVAVVTPVRGDQYVSCHTLPFPYAVYQCHTAREGYSSYMVSLRGLRDGSAVDMLAFCHLDTAGWNPAFEVLHTKPGGAPVCHFTPYGNLAFVKTATITA